MVIIFFLSTNWNMKRPKPTIMRGWGEGLHLPKTTNFSWVDLSLISSMHFIFQASQLPNNAIILWMRSSGENEHYSTWQKKINQCATWWARWGTQIKHTHDAGRTTGACWVRLACSIHANILIVDPPAVDYWGFPTFSQLCGAFLLVLLIPDGTARILVGNVVWLYFLWEWTRREAEPGADCGRPGGCAANRWALTQQRVAYTGTVRVIGSGCVCFEAAGAVEFTFLMHLLYDALFCSLTMLVAPFILCRSFLVSSCSESVPWDSPPAGFSPSPWLRAVCNTCTVCSCSQTLQWTAVLGK